MRNIVKLVGHQRLIEGKHGPFVYNHHDHYVGMALELYGEYSEHEFELFKQLLKPTDHVIEVGANIGSHTVPLGKYLSEGMVHAFEPQPVVFQNLCANLSINSLENVLAWPYAVGAEHGSIVVPGIDYGRPGNFGAVSLKEEGDGFNVTLIPLDAYAHDFDVALIKADVEGMEKHVLDGGKRVIERCRPILYLENDRVEKSKDLIEACWSMNYKLYWHIVRLYNPDNYFGNNDNIYQNTAAFNMLCIPKERESSVDGGAEISDSSFHPVRQ